MGDLGIQVTGDLESRFREESGKHVVQRAHARGKRHTSTVSVSALRLLPPGEGAIPDSDVRVTTQRGHGPGGQHQNKTDSAVRMVHLPTGIEVFINGRCQHANRRQAKGILESRVAELRGEEAAARRTTAKRALLGGGSRSGKRRTYSFIETRVTDHVTGVKSAKLKRILKGEFDLLR